jgi:hypothetical protein
MSAVASSTNPNPIPNIYSDGTTPSEVYNIAAIENVPLIFQQGLLSKKRSIRLNPRDIANNEVQGRREGKPVSNPVRDSHNKRQLTLHQYANLYIRVHNAMMYDICIARKMPDEICVLRIDRSILARREVVIADKNASKDSAQFHQASNFHFDATSTTIHREKCSYLWDERGTDAEVTRKAVCQAEVLVPYKIHPSYIRGIYVANDIAEKALLMAFNDSPPVPIEIHPSLFFQPTEKVRRGPYPLSDFNSQGLSNNQYPDIVLDSPESSDDEATVIATSTSTTTTTTSSQTSSSTDDA